MKLASGHEAVPLDEKAMQRQTKDWGRYADGLVKLRPGGWFFPKRFTKLADRFYNFEFRSSDIVVMSYPKSGSTWLQEIIWTMQHNPDLNHSMAHEDIYIRSKFLDFDIVRPSGMTLPTDQVPNTGRAQSNDFPEGIALLAAETSPDPRIIKTHIAFPLLSPSFLDTTKVVYVARNPKDVIVSFYHHSRTAIILDYSGSLDNFVTYFLDGEILYGPYWQHLKEAWQRKEHPNMYFIFYEDLKRNTIQELKKLNNFLSTNLTEEQLERIATHSSFQNMKERNKKSMSNAPQIRLDVTPVELEKAERRRQIVKEEGGFYRKGEVGDWRTKLTPEMDTKIDQWITDNITIIGLSFSYCL